MNITPQTLFTALSHDTRLRCLLLLWAYEELCVCDLVRAVGASQPHVSRHLAHLREAGLVSDRREGLWIHYRVNPELPAWVNALIEQTARGIADQPPYNLDQSALADDQRQGRCS